MAACGASDKGGGAAAGDGGAGDLDAFVDALGDALVDPVKDAKAEPLPPDVATEPCDKTGTNGTYAVHQYPGKTANELALVHAVVRYSAPAYTIGGLGYDPTVATFVRDGSVAVWCQSPLTVTFVMAR